MKDEPKKKDRWKKQEALLQIRTGTGKKLRVKGAGRILTALLLMAGCSSPAPAFREHSASSALVSENAEDFEASLSASKQDPSQKDSSMEAVEFVQPEASGTGQRADSRKEWDPQSVLETMSLEQKAAQLFLVTPEDLARQEEMVLEGSAIEEGFSKIPVAGLIVFSGNLENKEQIQKMNRTFDEISRSVCGLPALLAVDEEGGQVARLGSLPDLGLPVFEDAAVLGQAGDSKAVYEEGRQIGSYLYDLGFNVDFAPDADVLTNPENTVVARRSYGSDPKVVSEMAQAFAQGLLKSGILPCYKHFPGHGGTSGDTHDGYAASFESAQEIDQGSLIPFQDGIRQKIPMIMAAHIALPALDSSGLPASLSPVILTDLLRSRLGYEGVIITDAMNMGAIAQNYDSSQAVLQALQAGADLILMPGDLEADWKGVIEAVESGSLSQKRLDQSVLRILELKKQIEELRPES